MSKIIHSTIEVFPQCKLIGISAKVKALSPDIPQLWDKAMEMNLFETLSQWPGLQSPDFWGAEYAMNGDTFTYLVCMVFDASTKTPEGLESVLLPEMTVLHTQVEGPSHRIYGDTYPLSVEEAKRLGYTPDLDQDFCAEVYTQAFHDSRAQGSNWVLDHILPIV